MTFSRYHIPDTSLLIFAYSLLQIIYIIINVELTLLIFSCFEKEIWKKFI